MGIFDWTRRHPTEVLPPRGDTFGAGAALAMAGMRSTAPQAQTAAVGAMSETPSVPGLVTVPGKIKRDPRAERARFYARRVPFVKKCYRFYAYQGARCPLRLERSLNGGVDWEPVPVEADPWGNGVVQTIRGPGGTSAELLRPALYLDGCFGEFMLIDVTKDGVTPAFVVRDVNACKKQKRASRTMRRAQQPGQKELATYLVQNQEGAKLGDGDGAAFEVTEDRVYRHWQEDEEWHLMATSSLIAAVDDLDTYWGLLRQVRREVNSRLAMANILWTPTEAHTTKVTVNGQQVSKLQASFAAAAAASLNDVDDSDVASSSPVMIDTPSDKLKPEIISVPSLRAELLTYLQDARAAAVADLPLSSGALLDSMASENHWGEWLADDRDIETVSEGLRRVCDTMTAAIARPAWSYGLQTGAWKPAPVTTRDDAGRTIKLPGPTDVMMYRVGFDPEVLRRTLDLSEKAQWAHEHGLIHDDAAREYMHFRETDAPDEEQWQLMLQRRAELAAVMAPLKAAQMSQGVLASELQLTQQQLDAVGGKAGPLAAPTAPAQLPAGGPVPNGGTPPAPSAAQAASVVVIDDRWMLNP